MAKEYGYAGKILRVDLSSGRLSEIPTRDYAERFLGGRGIAAKIYWDEVSPQVQPFDEANKLIVMTGPLCGYTGVAGSRWTVSGKSPSLIVPYFSTANFGGSWGAYLKFAGYDGIIIEGKSDKPVYLSIEDGKAEIKDASHIWGKTTFETRDILKGELGRAARVVATSPAGENLVSFGTLLADEDSSGGAGFGAVAGSKKLKAIAVRGSGRLPAADPDRLRELGNYLRALKKCTVTPHWPDPLQDPSMKKYACFGCISGCERANFTAPDGTTGKFACQAGRFYRTRAQRFYGKWNEVPFLATNTCNAYGIDTDVIEPMIMWLLRCYRAGVLDEENSGIPITKVGSIEFMRILCHKIAHREGLGDLLAQGTLRAAEVLGSAAQKAAGLYINRKDNGSAGYDPRLYITAGVLWAMEERPPRAHLHEMSWLLVTFQQWVKKVPGAYVSGDVVRAIARKFWGSELAGDFSTYEAKAMAARKIQDRQYAKDSLILCDLTWPIMWTELTSDHVGDPSVESKILSAVTGKEVDEEGLYKIGERVFNLQRAIIGREGHRGRASDKLPDFYFTVPIEADAWNEECLAPGKDGQTSSKRGTVLEREKFEKLMDEYYELRGWDVPTGLQTRAKLQELGLGDIADGLAKEGLLAGKA